MITNSTSVLGRLLDTFLTDRVDMKHEKEAVGFAFGSFEERTVNVIHEF